MITLTYYPNRRLYEKRKGYVSLQDILPRFLQGEDLTVIRACDKQDVTGQVLASMLTLRVSEGLILETDMIRRILR
jgi:polyhydroxyalkanoate synthesis regulator protein